MLRTAVVTKRTLRTIIGKLSFVSGLVPQMRPFLSLLWAVSTCGSTDDGPTGKAPAFSDRRLNKGLPPHLAHVSRVRDALCWALALLLKQAGSLTRVLPLSPLPHGLKECASYQMLPRGA